MTSDREAKQKITEAIHRYTRGEDRIDRDLSRTIWTEDAFLNYGNVFKTRAAEFIEDNTGLLNHFATHHQVGNVLIDVDGNTANSEAYVTAKCWNFSENSGDPVELIAIGRYCDRWVRRNGKWRSEDRHFVLDMMYSWSPPHIPGGGTLMESDRNRDAIEGRRHPDDPSYDFIANIAHKATSGSARLDLEAKQAITEAIHRYARAEDRIDGELSKTVWTDESILDYGPLFKESAPEFVKNQYSRLSPFFGTHHHVGNILIDVEGDRATSEAYVTARCWNYIGDSGDLTELVAFGRYCDRWACDAGIWRNTGRHFVFDMMYSWSPPRVPGNATLTGPDRNPAAAEGRRGHVDPSYDFVANIARKAADGSGQGDLEAKQAITEAIHRYTRGEDRVDRDLSRTIWTEDAMLNYGNVFKRSAAEFIEDSEGLLRFFGTHHQVGNVLIDVEGDTANSEAYVTARCWNFIGDSGEIAELISFGRYCDRWIRKDGKWRSEDRHFILDMMYSWSPPRIPGGGTLTAPDRNRNAPEGRRQPVDPSYDYVTHIARKAARV